jgi:hypothetical protein
MSISGILLGLINVVIVVVLSLFVGAVGQYILTKLTWPPTEIMVKLYLALVALIALYMIVALLFGIPTIRFVHW